MSANETDSLATRLSGTDPQSLLEYITRQRIYDSRFWKEECFGLTATHVLEKAANLSSIGGLPNHFLSLLLKLIQLHPEHELIQKAFIEQAEDFKYVRALGALYIRLTSRPVEIYETLEPLYADARLLRVWVTPKWNLIPMDVYIDNLLHQSHVLTMALPRLPARRFLEEAGYLPEGPRLTQLQESIDEHGGGPLEYLKHLALVERHEGAMAAWTKRGGVIPEQETKEAEIQCFEEPMKTSVEHSKETQEDKPKKNKKKKKKDRNYDNLFKKAKTKTTTKDEDAKDESESGPTEGSEEYWNEQRVKLGLGKLK